MEKNKIGIYLKEYMQKKGIEASYVAEKINLPVKSVEAMLNGQKKMKVSEYYSICEMLDIELIPITITKIIETIDGNIEEADEIKDIVIELKELQTQSPKIYKYLKECIHSLLQKNEHTALISSEEYCKQLRFCSEFNLCNHKTKIYCFEYHRLHRHFTSKD